MRILIVERSLPQRAAVHLDFRDGFPLVAFHQRHVSRRHARAVFGQGWFRRAAHLADQCEAVGRRHQHLGSAGSAQTRAILVRRFEDQIVMAVLDRIHAQAVRCQARQ